MPPEEEREEEEIPEEEVEDILGGVTSPDKPYYLDEKVGYNTVIWLLKPDIPEKYRAEFSKFLIAIDKLTALGNIEREDVLRFKILFRLVTRWYKLGLPKYARQYLAEFLFEMQLTRSIDGFERIMQTTTRQETIQGTFPPVGGGGTRKRGILGRLFGGGE